MFSKIIALVFGVFFSPAKSVVKAPCLPENLGEIATGVAARSGRAPAGWIEEGIRALTPSEWESVVEFCKLYGQGLEFKVVNGWNSRWTQEVYFRLPDNTHSRPLEFGALLSHLEGRSFLPLPVPNAN